jgi:hypothetical protein
MNYYYTDGKERFGPFTLAEFRTRNITRDTLVWREGLIDWMPAGNLSELESLFIQNIAQEPVPTPVHALHSMADMPKSWLVESILITIVCCLPLGIVGIILSIKMETLWKFGEYKAAQMLSDEAGRWVRIGFFVGIVLWILMFLYGMFLRSMIDMMSPGQVI